MFSQRVMFALVALPVGLFFVFWGGWPYALFIILIMARAAWEYADLFHDVESRVSHWVVVAEAVALLISRYVFGFGQDHGVLVGLCMVALTFHLVDYERGSERAASGFAATLSGMAYIGLLGSYMILVREIPQEGPWWMVLILFAVMLADTTAYMFGTKFGRHRLAPRLSPHKSWEGFIAGVVAATVGTPLFLLLFRLFGLPDTPSFSLLNIALLGLILGILPTLGDLGISMIKREKKFKDSSDILPGHGGVLDRIDSWLWAFPIGYYLVTLFFL